MRMTSVEELAIQATPVDIAVDQPLPPLAPITGIALCMSGGGFRAMLFHLGALHRLNEMGLLRSLDTISSVSGGSIVAAYLGYRWKDLKFDQQGVATNLSEVMEPVRQLATRRIDLPNVLKGVLLPLYSAGDALAASLAKHLFGKATLQSLPDRPTFIINATNVQTNALWTFSKASMGDYRIGRVLRPEIELAKAVAASASFPPFFSPYVLKMDPSKFGPNSGKSKRKPELQMEPYTSKIHLTDGGVYDNLGLQSVWKGHRVLLVSDAGQKMLPEPNPAHDWLQHTVRTAHTLNQRATDLIKQKLVQSLRLGKTRPDLPVAREGAYWGIGTNITRKDTPGIIHLPGNRSHELARIPTGLSPLPEPTIRDLVNWGYACADCMLRRHYMPQAQPPAALPFPTAPDNGAQPAAARSPRSLRPA